MRRNQISLKNFISTQKDLFDNVDDANYICLTTGTRMNRYLKSTNIKEKNLLAFDKQERTEGEQKS